MPDDGIFGAGHSQRCGTKGTAPRCHVNVLTKLFRIEPPFSHTIEIQHCNKNSCVLKKTDRHNHLDDDQQKRCSTLRFDCQDHRHCGQTPPHTRALNLRKQCFPVMVLGKHCETHCFVFDVRVEGSDREKRNTYSVCVCQSGG